jgi:hypothetical protein
MAILNVNARCFAIEPRDSGTQKEDKMGRRAGFSSGNADSKETRGPLYPNHYYPVVPDATDAGPKPVGGL